MTRNMGTADRSVRVLLAIVVAVLYFRGAITGTLATVLGVIAAVFVLTSAIGFCPAYVPLRLSTARRKTSGVQPAGRGR